MNYLLIVPIKYYRINDNQVALESAFIEHVKLLNQRIKSVFHKITLAMIEMDVNEYQKYRQSFGVLDEVAEGIFVDSICQASAIEGSNNWVKNILKFYGFYFFSYANKITNLVKESDLVHAGPSSIMQIPIFLSIIIGIILGKKTISVVDIDFRNSALMNLKTGRWSRKSYWLTKYIYDPMFSFQINLSVLFCSLVFLKGKKLCQDYGQGKTTVKNFLDSAYSKEYIIKEYQLLEKIAKVQDEDNPLEIVYFGRLVSYKGIDSCIRAISEAQKMTQNEIIFHIIGCGDQENELKELMTNLHMDNVIFHGAVPYGSELFEKLYNYHLLLAAPLSEDTPRSALDAMAAGIPILAFDTYYYKDLEATGAAITVPWLSTEQMADKIANLNNNRKILAEMMGKSVIFANENTQESWLDQRWQWTKEVILCKEE